jgi:hypothetical protein
VAELLNFAMKEKLKKGIILNNRDVKCAWPKETHQIWEIDSRYTQVMSNKKMEYYYNDANQQSFYGTWT